jgi:16S rRNA (uracil1498-N3)-methyltransferase
MIQFYAPDILTTHELPAEEAGHCTRVLRKTVGDEIYATDGKGNRYLCRITEATNKRVALEILDTVTIAPHWGKKLTLAVAPTKNADRMEWLVEKAVEIGVDEIVFLRCAHSERKEMKTSRLEKIMVSAMKQSLKTTLPKLNVTVPIKDFIAQFRADDDVLKFVAHCDHDLPRRILAQECGKMRDTVLLIGPEGDFTVEEIEQALATGFIAVSLGESRLRTETAAIFGLSVIHALHQANDK